MKEMTCAEVNSILEKLSPADREQCCKSLVKIISTDKEHTSELDEIITAVILYAYECEIIPLLLTCELLIISIDFKILVSITAEKIKFVRSKMHMLDYKGMRDLIKTLLVEKLDKLPQYLTEHQRRQLIPIEELTVDLIDRKKNFCPALFIITEISRISLTSHVHILPKVSLKIREVVASFRPLAEICTMIGRTWMYPITAHLCYHSQVSSWKLSDGKLHFKTHLPYSTENCAPQSYFQYILLKQPRGHENLSHFIRPVMPTVPPPKIQCNEIMQMLILEAMCAIEESEHDAIHPINQYNWMHIVHLVVYALCHHTATSYGSFDQLIEMLRVQLKISQYRKARGELMWLLLNFISYAVTEKIPINENDITDIFNILYPDEPVWAGCSTDTVGMVRFFAPAAIWSNLARQTKSGEEPPKPPEKLARFSTMLELEKKQYLSEEFLAVVANAHPSDPENPKMPNRHVQQALLKKIEASTEDPSHQWLLPHGHKTDSHVIALDMTLLDSLTFYAKHNITYFLLMHLKEVCNVGRLPSPALIETLTRLPFASEVNRLSSLIFQAFITEIQTFGQTLSEIHNDPTKSNSLNINTIAILAQIIIYRFLGSPVSLANKCLALKAAYDGINWCCKMAIPALQAKMHHLYGLMEQIIMRIFIWTPPSELIHVLAYAMKFNLLAPPAMFGQDTQPYGAVFHVCPEISRIFLINLIRSYKLAYSGDLGPSDSLASLSQVHKFPESVRRWFPENLQHACKVDEGPNDDLFNIYQKQSDADWAMWNQWIQQQQAQYTESFWNDCANQFITERHGQYTLLISVFRYMDGGHPPPVVFKILSMMKIKDLILNVNAFVDYILYICKQARHDNERFIHLVGIVDKMVFEFNYISFDRFFLAMVMHPNDDSSIEFALLILHTLITQFRNFVQHINIIHYLPSHYTSATSNSQEFFKNMTEYYNKFPEYTYGELQSFTCILWDFGGEDFTRRRYVAAKSVGIASE
uniref:Mediator of RNA polymerase II transcription subunit 23 n=1 Tax=Acrobeloides nanus TaxID=290746 RepID=A0A914C1R3_9BILA